MGGGLAWSAHPSLSTRGGSKEPPGRQAVVSNGRWGSRSEWWRWAPPRRSSSASSKINRSHPARDIRPERRCLVTFLRRPLSRSLGSWCTTWLLGPPHRRRQRPRQWPARRRATDRIPHRHHRLAAAETTEVGTNTQRPIDERDRDRALARLRWLTAASGLASLAVAAFATSAAAQASTPPVHPAGGGLANPVAGSLSAEQLAALKFGLPKPGTVVIWATPGQAPAPGRAVAPGSAPAGAPAPAPRPAPTPPPPPVATSGTS